MKYKLNTKINYLFEKFTTRLFKLKKKFVGEQKLFPRPVYVNQVLIKTDLTGYGLDCYFLLLNFFKVYITLVFNIFRVV